MGLKPNRTYRLAVVCFFGGILFGLAIWGGAFWAIFR